MKLKEFNKVCSCGYAILEPEYKLTVNGSTQIIYKNLKCDEEIYEREVVNIDIGQDEDILVYLESEPEEISFNGLCVRYSSGPIESKIYPATAGYFAPVHLYKEFKNIPNFVLVDLEYNFLHYLKFTGEERKYHIKKVFKYLMEEISSWCRNEKCVVCFVNVLYPAKQNDVGVDFAIDMLLKNDFKESETYYYKIV